MSDDNPRWIRLVFFLMIPLALIAGTVREVERESTASISGTVTGG